MFRKTNGTPTFPATRHSHRPTRLLHSRELRSSFRYRTANCSYSGWSVRSGYSWRLLCIIKKHFNPHSPRKAAYTLNIHCNGKNREIALLNANLYFVLSQMTFARGTTRPQKGLRRKRVVTWQMRAREATEATLHHAHQLGTRLAKDAFVICGSPESGDKVRGNISNCLGRKFTN